MQQVPNLLVALFVTAAITTAAAQTNAPTNSLTVEIEKARVEKQIDQRLQMLARVANELPLTEIPAALEAADNLKSMREQLVFRDSALKRWGGLLVAFAARNCAIYFTNWYPQYQRAKHGIPPASALPRSQ